MPIVFVHGVAVRDEEHPQRPAVERLTRGADWPVVERALREHVAPVVHPADPERVFVAQAYWGDLGAAPSERVEPVGPPDDALIPAALTPAELAESWQAKLFEELPPARWAAVVRAVSGVTGEPSLPAQLAARSAERQVSWLDEQVHERLIIEAPELARAFGPMAADVAATSRKGVRRAMSEVRRPFQDIVPIFVGDVLTYLRGRGQPGAPGPITTRVLETMAAAHAARHTDDEPLVVLSHSMGGQIVYDVLTAFADDAPGGMPFVDVWASSGGQIGLFAELGLFLAGPSPALVGVPRRRLGYLWNAWSSSDVLSFAAQGRVARAVDSDFAYTGTPPSTHLAYLRDPDFYRTLAAFVEVHSRRS